MSVPEVKIGHASLRVRPRMSPAPSLAGAAAYTRSVKIEGTGRGGKAVDMGFKPTQVTRVE